MKNTQYLFIDRSKQPPSEISVEQLGIHERMPPGTVRHGGDRFPVLFMFFHSPAQVWLAGADPAPAEQCLIIWDRGAWHHYGNEVQEWDHSWMMIHGDRLAHLLAATATPLSTLLKLQAESLCLRYFRLLYDELQQHGNEDQVMLEGILHLWLHELVRARAHGGAAPEVPARLMEVCRHMENTLRQPMSLADWAHRAKLSVSQFSALFQRHYGCSPMRYAANLRLQRSARLLLDPNISIKEAAAAVGFTDSLYFSRQFRRRLGCSPSAWRRRYG